MMPRTGVIPDPAATQRKCPPGAGPSQKRPCGGIASMTSPGARSSFAQAENAPPSTRLMPIRRASPGAVQIE